jgi:AraC family L-rhamnose operon transcriptional activator RhaR
VLEARISPQDADETVAELGSLQDLLTRQPERRILLLGRLLAILGRLVEKAGDSGSGSGSGGGGSAAHPAVSAATSRLDAAPEHPWQLDELARAVNLDPAYLTRLFRRHLGLSPITYLARLRAEKAAGLLARTTLPVARVGSLVGWPDPTYFARRFRSMVGLTPSGYRQRLRRDDWTHGVRDPAGDRGDSGVS